MTAGPGEAELVGRARAGDEEALTELLARRAPELRKLLEGRIPDRWRSLLTVDDLLQETFTDAFVDVARFVPVGEDAFGAWLRTLARNNLRDALRALEADKRGGGARPRSGSTLEALCDRVVALSTASPSRAAQKAELVDALRAAIDRLPEVYARVVRGYDLEGRSIEAMAAELDRTPGATYLVRHRALRRLAELLGGSSAFLGA